MMHSYTFQLLIFTSKILAYDPIYDMKLGVLMKKSEFQAYGDNQKFKQFFVFKDFHEGITIHYLPKKLEKGKGQ